MVPTDRFLEGLFAPHGGLVLSPTAPVRESQLARVIRALAESIFGVRELRKSDFALCH